MKVFLYDRYGYTVYRNILTEQHLNDLKMSARFPLYTKIIVSETRKRRVFCKETKGWGRETIFFRSREGWKQA